ncbi:leucyl/phenylalanyl-tRNA--protein transferase [Paracandidimonas soli]|uniref:Leucyl/phenylalanyl-tRNA--protein transferase n=1 Tax=Paracandidimonas soli TaxID=1917182 RepID=A0A4R3UUG3_9BURK|nr:leucyl/phenylalanyl-tRNA--protein transferase [Paracandidimonas soli]TCU93674.1 leucyl/phenylalanyl-tRNA--protein transferase [Paracandidimonas soli]
MDMLTWIDGDTPFPPPERALPDGLLAVGGTLDCERLLAAYTQGIFPWYSPGDPVLWWSPDPRMVLECGGFHPSHSLRKRLRQLARADRDPEATLQVRVDTAFAQVIAACAEPGPGRPSTWITAEIQAAYTRWHEAGRAHSIETWQNGILVGGLYGVSLGRMFFGESMFSRATDASKIALAYLVCRLRACGVELIDCQQQTSHLASLGAGPVPRGEFLRRLAQLRIQPGPEWRPGRLLQTGELVPLPQGKP